MIDRVVTTTLTVPYDGGTATLEPAKYADGKPVLFPLGAPANLISCQLFLAQVDNGNGGTMQKCITREVLPDPVNPRAGVKNSRGETAYLYKEQYINPSNGNTFPFPICEGEQTVCRTVKPDGATYHRDLYLLKGFRFATLDDMMKLAQRTRENAAAWAKNKALSGREAQAENLADKLVNAAGILASREDAEKQRLREENEALKKQVANGKK